MMKKDTKLEQLTDYIGMGWHIFPVFGVDNGNCECGEPKCSNPGKHPMTPKGFKDATTEIDQIVEWDNNYPNANWAVATGALSGIVVLDIDPENGGDKTISNFPLPDTPYSKTGGGGIHYLYSHPGDEIRSTAGRIGAGVDVRADGGYAILPPSIHRSGNEYDWVINPKDVSLAPTPEWLIKRNRTLNLKLIKKTNSVTIPEGRRNTYLTSIAGTLKNRELSTDAIRNALFAIDQADCESPLPQEEIQAIAKSSKKWKVNSIVQDYPPTDTGNAERLRDLFGHKLKYVHEWGWISFNGKFWEKNNSIANRYAIYTIRNIRSETDLIGNEDSKQRTLQWSIKSESNSKIQAMLTRAKSEIGIAASPDKFDNNPWLLNCENGTIDLISGVLKRHDPNDLITKYIPWKYNPDAGCTLWKEFLDRVLDGNQEMVDYLQKAVGYSLTGSTKEQVLFIFLGSGANGKTTFLETIRALLCKYACQADFNTFLESKNNNINNDLARLVGKRFVVATEVGKGRRLSEVTVKQVTGGDIIAARYLYQEYFEFHPQFKIFMATNYLPTISGNDNAIWRRIRVIEFPVTIPEEDQDKDLVDKLKEELEGILAWAVGGCIKWQQEGLGIPPDVENATNEYRSEMDVIGSFIDDCCTTNGGDIDTFKALYEAYHFWCQQNDENSVNRKAFGNELKGRGFNNGKTNKGAIRYGIRVNQSK